MTESCRFSWARSKLPTNTRTKRLAGVLDKKGVSCTLHLLDGVENPVLAATALSLQLTAIRELLQAGLVTLAAAIRAWISRSNEDFVRHPVKPPGLASRAQVLVKEGPDAEVIPDASGTAREISGSEG